jgi:hypothetical protein
VLAVPVPALGLRFEGEILRPVEVGHSDTDDTTVLHVPSIGLVVAGDVAYNGVHQYLLEGGGGGPDRLNPGPLWYGALSLLDG